MPNYKNPNGYGSVVKLSGHRRNPFAVRRTVGYDDRAYPIYQIVGYYPSRKDAVLALAKYNNKPYNIDLAKLTFKELYERWSKECLPKLGTSLQSAHKSAYKHCSTLYDTEYRSIRKMQMQACIDDCGRSYATQTNIKNLFTQLDKYAYDLDIIEKCYSANLTTSERDVKIKRNLFTDKEVQTLLQHIGEPCVDETLFLLFTGCRVTEMLTLKQENIDFQEKTMCFGIKTAAGKHRIVPIHDKLLPILESHKNGLFVFDNEKWVHLETAKTKYSTFVRHWDLMLKQYGMKHTTHDCRHTVRSKLDSKSANKVCIDRIIGHKNTDVGERVYTHKSIQELKEAMSLLNYDS